MNGNEILEGFERSEGHGPLEDQTEQQKATWPEIPTKSKTPPVFPTDMLPDRLARCIHSVSIYFQVPESMIAGILFGTVSGVMVGRVRVQPKPYDAQYMEMIQLFIIVAGASGERKTGILAWAKKRYEDLYANEKKETERENQGCLNLIKAKEVFLKKSKSEQDYICFLTEIDKLKENLKQTPEPISGSDITVETVSDTMVEHGGRAVVLADEAAFINALSGRSYRKDGGAVNIDAVLSGYSGSNASGRRVTRGEWVIKNANLSICVCIQPSALNAFMGDLEGMGRGLHGRFLYFLGTSMIGNRQYNPPGIPEDVQAWWDATIERLFERTHRRSEPLTVRFSDEAEGKFRAFFERVEQRRLTTLMGTIETWANKYVGNTARLAAIIALLDECEQVEVRHWNAAEVVSESYLLPCARLCFGESDPSLSEDAVKLLEKIRDLDYFQSSEWWQKNRNLFGRIKPRFDAALKCLSDGGYIRVAEQPKNETGRKRTTPMYEVNPQVRETPDE